MNFTEHRPRHLVAILDSPTFSTPTFVAELEASYRQKIEVSVTITSDDDINWFADPRIERERVSEVLRILRPHFPYIERLKFYTAHASSLPFFPTDFDGNFSTLRALELEAVDHDRHIVNTEYVDVSEDELECFNFHPLKTLTITGRNCFILSTNEDWTDMIPKIINLTISQFTPRRGESFTLPNFLMPIAEMQSLENLTIRNLDIDNCTDGLTSLQRKRCAALSLCLQGMDDFSITRNIVDFLGPHVLDLRSSSAGADTSAFICKTDGGGYYGGSLKLHDMDEEEDLEPLLQTWSGESLEVSFCPSFTDDTIYTMCYEEEDIRCFRYASQMTSLTIKAKVLNVSIAALKELVTARLSDDMTTDIEFLRIYTNAPEISEEDRAWFVRRLKGFTYRPLG